MSYEGYTVETLPNVMGKKTVSLGWLVLLPWSQIAGSGTGAERVTQQASGVWGLRNQERTELHSNCSESPTEQWSLLTWSRKCLRSYWILITLACCFLWVTFSGQRRAELLGESGTKSLMLSPLPPSSTDWGAAQVTEILTPICFVLQCERPFKSTGSTALDIFKHYI